MAFGGETQHGTLHVELNAHACRLITDWNSVRTWGETYSASITRVDVAHDDEHAQGIDVDRARDWFRDGNFNVNGRPPRSQFIDDMGSNHGRTLYVGRRGSGKTSGSTRRGSSWATGKPVGPGGSRAAEQRTRSAVGSCYSTRRILSRGIPRVAIPIRRAVASPHHAASREDQLRGDGATPPCTGGKVSQRHVHRAPGGRRGCSGAASPGRGSQAARRPRGRSAGNRDLRWF